MARKPVTDIAAWPALTLEGNLLSPAMIAAIDRREATEQEEAAYGLRKGLFVRDEISLAFRVGQAHFTSFAKSQSPSPAATTNFIQGFLQEVLGFDDLTSEQMLVAGNERIPVVIVPPTDTLDRKSACLSSDRARSAALVLQDFLNAKDSALWGIATNGSVIRLMRDNASLTRPAYIEANLTQIFETEDIASFAIFWLLFHRTRFGKSGHPPTDCALERWRDAGAKVGEVARDRLASQVEQALKDLGTGFLAANPDLRQKLQSHDIPLTDWFNELLRLVYRLIFLMVAEDRDLLHAPKADADARRLYAEGYSLSTLRTQSARRAAWDRHHDRFEGLKIVFAALTHGEARLGLPALGGLFAPGQLPDLETARLSNRSFLSAIFHLGWLSDGRSMAPVNWRSMETEELGSVYESLLELQPQLAKDGRALVFATENSEKKGNQRKTTGSYYTPDSLVQALLDTALDPVLDRAEAEAADPAQALLALSVIDPACGSGHFLLAAARRIATRLARHRAGGTPSATDYRHALRDVARHCIHGVDRNPMAVELTKVALWIETVDPGLPLGFFDAQIRCGDSLLGIFDIKALEAGIPDGAYKPLAGDDKETAKHFAKRNKSEKSGQGSLNFASGASTLPPAKALADLGGKLRALPETTLIEIDAKARAFRDLRAGSGWYGWKIACDAYIAAFLAPKIGGVPDNYQKAMIPTTAHVWGAMAGHMPYGPLVARIDQFASNARAFHWPLEFPEIMARGGFDAVLGNPPWERIKLQEQEFFAARSPEIANAPNKAAREKLIKALAMTAEGSTDRTLYNAFLTAKREAEAASEFVRTSAEDGGRFPLTGRGDVNTYALFAEHFSKLVGSKGRAGVIVPTGIATDATTAPFFAALVEGRRLYSLISFREIRALFLATDDRNSFCLLTLSYNEDAARFAFSLLHPAQQSESERNFTLSPKDIAAINPNTKTAPVFRSHADARLTAKIYANAPILIDEARGAAGNPWGVTFLAMFHMSNDSSLFRTAAQLQASGFAREGTDWVATGAGAGSQDLSSGGSPSLQRYVPLYEAKMIHQFDHRWASYAENGQDTADIATTDKQNPAFEPTPRYWVPQAEVDARLSTKGWTHGWLMGWRDIARATDERTLISGIIPRTACGDKYLLTISTFEPRACAALFGNMNSLTTDFVARQKLGGISFKYFTMRQIAILPPTFYTEPCLSFIVPRVLELTYTSHSLAPFARDLGYDGPPFAWDEDRRALLRADLDAFYARAYDLNRDELRYILDPADVKGPDYPSETFRVLKEKEIRTFGEYRTRRLVLAAWDRMEADGTFAELGLADGTAARPTIVTIQLPPLSSLRNGSWTWPSTIQPRDRLRYAAQYALWLMDQNDDGSRMRFLVACLAEPALLTPLLNDADKAHWQRLIGAEARPPQGVVRLRQPVNEAWRSMVETLVTSGQLEERADGDWMRGRHFDPAGLRAESSDAQRACFALNAIRQIKVQQLTAAVAQEDNVIWMRFDHG